MLISSHKPIDLGRVRAKNLAFKQEKVIKIGSLNVSVIEGLLTVSLFCFGFIYSIASLAFLQTLPEFQSNYTAILNSIPFLAQKLNPLFADNEFQ